MTALTITGKGQVTLRKELLRHLGVAPGDKIEVDMLPNGRIEARAARRTRHISDIFGALGHRLINRIQILEAASLTRAR